MRRPAVAPPATPLTDSSLKTAVGFLASRDPDLAAVVDRHGYPPLWGRRPGFATLVRIVLEQRVSLSSALAALGRINGALGVISPRSMAGAGFDGLRACGLSRQKARYCVALAHAIQEGRFDPGSLSSLADDEVRARLTELVGFGPWSADIYLLMALARPDVWPAGDRALEVQLSRIKRLPAPPTGPAFLAEAEPWRPYRSAAARLLWWDYLGGREPTPLS